VSRAARRHARRQHRRNQVVQSRARTPSVPLDESWVQGLRRISDRVAANLREIDSITKATADALGMPEEDATDLLGRYVAEADDDGHHPDGLLGWLATKPEGVAFGVETPSGVQYVPRRPSAAQTTEDQDGETGGADRPLPELTVTVNYPPGSSPLAEEGAVVTVPFVLERDEEGRLKFDVRVRSKTEDFCEERARILMSTTVDYLRMTWSEHSDVLDAMAQSEPSNIKKLLVDEDHAINARGGAA
jgi:hypothetical protein